MRWRRFTFDIGYEIGKMQFFFTKCFHFMPLNKIIIIVVVVVVVVGVVVLVVVAEVVVMKEK